MQVIHNSIEEWINWLRSNHITFSHEPAIFAVTDGRPSHLYIIVFPDNINLFKHLVGEGIVTPMKEANSNKEITGVIIAEKRLPFLERRAATIRNVLVKDIANIKKGFIDKEVDSQLDLVRSLDNEIEGFWGEKH